jgi:hypothetical protein
MNVATHSAHRLRSPLSALALVTTMASCQAAPTAVEPHESEPPKKMHPEPTAEKPVMTGPLTRAQLTNIPKWTLPDTATVDVTSAQGLARVPPGAHVLAIVGTWCSDSKREVPRLYRALDIAAGTDAGTDAGTAGLPFTLEIVGVDRDKKSPGLTHDVAYVPTFIVTRADPGANGARREVGRIVESAPNGIEKDLLSLLDGSRSGVITGRHDHAP